MRKVGGQAISAQDKDTDETHAKPPRKRWGKRWWALGLWGFLGLIVILFALGLWAWTQRYDLLETRIIDILAEAGFEAELDVISVTRTQGQIKNIRLHRDGQEILDIEQIQAEYIWPDIRDLKFKDISIEGATARLNLGEDWLPTESWAREPLTNNSSAGSKPSFPFPENGVRLSDATVILSSPLGEAKFYMDAESSGEGAFKSDITLAPSDLSYGGYSAQGAGFASLEMSGDDLRIIGQAQTGTLSNGKVDFTDADVQVDGIFDLAAMVFLGSASLQSESTSSELYASGPARIAWDGTLSPKEQMRASGNWMISAENAGSPRSARAEDVAETLSLYPVISLVPVTEYYAPHMRDVVFDFLTGSDISGQGQLNYGPEGFSVNPVGTFLVGTDNNRLRLETRSDKNFYQFDKASEQITAHMNAAFERPVGLTLDNIHFTAASDNGLRLNGISGFSTQIATQADWKSVDSSQRPVRLDPLTAAFRYDATDNPRQLSVTTAFTYDGELPGSYVERLALDGRFDVRLYDGRQVLDFTPRSKSLVTLKSLETPTSWRGEMIQFTLPPTKELFTRTAKQSTFAALLNAADFTLTRPATDDAGPQVLDLSAAMMDVTGTLYPDAVQDWAIDFTQSGYNSETLPGPGTSAAVEKASLTARLAQGQEPQITLASPSITVETPLVQASNIQFEMQGTPDKYTAEHTGGTIFITGSEFAERAQRAGLGSFPANGSVNFSDGGFTGQANLRVARANDAAVNVDYTYKDGGGTADISVPSILFEPKGLQPQTLLPALSGKIARVTGEARANLKVGFAEGTLTHSSGTLDLVDIGVGTAPGPITGLNTKMRFASLLPLETAGPQTLSLESFNPGFPLENGAMTFNFVPEGVKVDAADWPIGNGSFSLDPFTWVYAADENRVTMRVKNIAVSDFLENMGNQKIQATGNVVGTFPVVVRGLDVLVENGKISVPEGGEIRYDPGPGVQSYSEAESIQVLRERRSQEYAAIAQDALREFKYRELSASLDGPLNGDVEIGLVFDGSNRKVLNQQPFRFDISVKGELFNIARSFNSNAQVKSEILRQNGKLPDGAIIGE